MAIVDKLRDLYIKVGGSEKESANTISEWLAKINAQLGGDYSGSPSNIEDWVDKIEDVWNSGGGSGGDSIPVEWTTLVEEDAVEFTYDTQYWVKPGCGSEDITIPIESLPLYFDVIRVTIDNEHTFTVVFLAGPSVYGSDGVHTWGVKNTFVGGENSACIIKIAMMNEETFTGTHSVKIETGAIGASPEDV